MLVPHAPCTPCDACGSDACRVLQSVARTDDVYQHKGKESPHAGAPQAGQQPRAVRIGHGARCSDEQWEAAVGLRAVRAVGCLCQNRDDDNEEWQLLETLRISTGVWAAWVQQAPVGGHG
jgi:hypothetical protein